MTRIPEHDIHTGEEVVFEAKPHPYSGQEIARFVLPSVLGVLAFLTPLKVGDSWTILLGVLSDWATNTFAGLLPALVILIVWVSALVSPAVKLAQPAWARPGSMAGRLFNVSWVWIFIRWAGAAVGTLVVSGTGPDWMIAANTGGVAMTLAERILALFFFAGFLMPFLTDFGLMEFFGSMMKRVFHVLFRLPGRSAIDALASWLSASSVGVLITLGQLSKGFYNLRDSAVIATNFSVVSVPFALIVAETIGIGHLFLQYYAAVVVAGLVCAVILPRIPPLSRIPEDFAEGVTPQPRDEDLSGSLYQQGMAAATARAMNAPSPKELVVAAVGNILDICIGLTPAVVAVATAGLAIAEFTPIVDWLTAPLVPVLDFFGLADAASAAPTFLVGYLDMFLPAALGADIPSEFTRFVVGAVSITQLIYMSEVGILITKSEIPLGFGKLLIIFLLRTVISFPIIVLFARLLVF